MALRQNGKIYSIMISIKIKKFPFVVAAGY
jgi:hypothetical protein